VSSLLVDERRQRARQEYLNGNHLGYVEALNAVIEVATQVKLTDEIIEAAKRQHLAWRHEGIAIATAVLEAAGLEVIP
jgi:hypothetical protein